MNKVIGILFALACFATSAQSNSMMGAGLWFWVIIATGFIVASSQFFPRLKGPGSGLALLLGIISICAILFGMIAATIGGSFKMDDSSALLLFLFFIIVVLGFTLAIMYKRSIRSRKT
jgi:hypothetical protein